MKKAIVSIMAAAVLLLAVPAYATSWEPGATATVTTENAVRSADADTPMYGYIGGATTNGVDVDGDGNIDIHVSASDIISVSVPLETLTRAEMYGSEVRFYSPEFEVFNNGGTPLRVEVAQFLPKAGNPLTLTAWAAAHGADDIAIKLKQAASDPNVWEKDVSALDGGYVLKAALLPGEYVKYRLDGNYAIDMLAKHKGETAEFECIYKIEAAE